MVDSHLLHFEIFVHGDCFLDHTSHRKIALDQRSRGTAVLLPEAGVFNCLPQRVSKSLRIPRRNKPARHSLVHDLPAARNVRR